MPGRQKNKHHLTVIGESLLGARTALSLKRMGGVFFAGSQEAPNLLCGKCGWILVSGRLRESLGDLVLKCPYCSVLNDTSIPFTTDEQ
jgi:phage FluMu protein Com